MWNLQSAVELCRKLEPIASGFGYHVALTGGCLYKHGDRKDADILFYRVSGFDDLVYMDMLDAFKDAGLDFFEGIPANHRGWLVRAKYEGNRVDLFFPDADNNDYGLSAQDFEVITG